MANNTETSVTFKVFNQDFNRAMGEMNDASKKLRQELKLEQEQLKLTGTESQKLESVLNNLQQQYDLARQKTQETAAQLEASKRQFGENSTEVARLETMLTRAQIAEQQLANRIETTTQSLEQARQAESSATTESQNRRQALQQLQTEQNNLRSSSSRLTSEYELQRAQMGDNASEAEKLVTAQNHVEQQAEVTRRMIANLEQQLALTEQEYGRNSTEANQMATRLNAARSSVANMTNDLEQMRSGGNNAADGMEEIGRRITAGNFMHAAEILSGVSDKVKELGKTAVDTALEIGDSQQDIQNNFGLTEKQAEDLQNVVTNVFEHGVTDSIETASKAVQNVKSYLGDLNNTDLETVTNKVIGIGKHTDTDVNENVRAASQLMSNFKLSANDSLDLIAAGFQNGLNKSDDFLDTLNEYSPHFAAAGYSADQMLQIIKNGMQNGALNTDKAADAVKEFQIRLGDGSFSKIVGDFSTNTQDMFKKWQDGKATVADVANSVSTDLNKMSPTQQQKALSDLSSQFEDLGVKGASALFSVGDAFKDVSGKADQMSQRSVGEKWQQDLRELKDSMAQIGQDIMNDLSPVIEALGNLAKGFSSIPEPVRFIIEIIGGLIIALTLIAPVIAAIIIVFSAFSVVNGVLTVSIGSLSFALWPVIAVIAAIIVVIIAVIAIIKNWGTIIEWLKSVWQSISEFFVGLWAGITSTFSSALTNIQTISSNVWNGIKGFISGVWDGIKSAVSGSINWIQSTVSSIWNSIKSTTSSVWNGIKSAITTPIEDAKNTISSIINTIKGFFSGIKLSIPKINMPALPHFSFTGKFSLNPPSVPHLNVDWYANGGFFDQASIIGIGEAGPEAALPLSGSRMDPFADAVANRMLSVLPMLVENKMSGSVQTQPIQITVVSELDGYELARNQVDYIDGMLTNKISTKAYLSGLGKE